MDECGWHFACELEYRQFIEEMMMTGSDDESQYMTIEQYNKEVDAHNKNTDKFKKEIKELISINMKEIYEELSTLNIQLAIALLHLAKKEGKENVSPTV